VIFTPNTFPASAPAATLLPQDTIVTNPSSGVAAVQVRLRSGTVPDSVVVTVIMLHLDSTAVSGSPLTFVVEFRP